MDKILNCMDIYDTLREAFDYVEAQMNPADLDLEILDAMVEGISAVTNEVICMQEEGSERSLLLAQKVREFLDACQMFSVHMENMGDILGSFKEWEQEFCELLYLRVLILVFRGEEDNHDKLIEVMDTILSWPIQQDVQLKAMTLYQLGLFLSSKAPRCSYELTLKAFEIYPGLLSLVTTPEHERYNYVYEKAEEIHLDCCPVCGGEGNAYYTALQVFMKSYSPIFSPVRMWMKCKSCEQLYTYNFSKRFLEEVKEPLPSETPQKIGMIPNTHFCSLFSEILKKAMHYNGGGRRLLEIGAGGGELTAVALELGCEVEAIEIGKQQARYLSSLLGIDVKGMDFADFYTENKFDIITMGDVIEHVTKPVETICKARDMLAEGGVLWISTPNYKSAYSRIKKFDDPMWKEPHHITYFSYEGLEKLLIENGMEVIDYSVSSRYNGSMEIFVKNV